MQRVPKHATALHADVLRNQIGVAGIYLAKDISVYKRRQAGPNALSSLPPPPPPLPPSPGHHQAGDVLVGHRRDAQAEQERADSGT